jgi:hypothetical protein
LINLSGYRTIFHLPCQSGGIEFINIILQGNREPVNYRNYQKGARTESFGGRQAEYEKGL